ncbi:MAG TPA: hypothetical protein VHC44_17860, partial [Verrucomicrobiae bacterium]|nr:hypothetical protein [Verrucomicrobiae bacterium]
MAGKIHYCDGEAVIILRVKKTTPPFESAANGGVEILFGSDSMSSKKSIGAGSGSGGASQNLY